MSKKTHIPLISFTKRKKISSEIIEVPSSKEMIDASQNRLESLQSSYGYDIRSFNSGFYEGVAWMIKRNMK